MSLLDLGPLGYRTVLYCTVSNMQVSLLVVYIGTRKMVTLQRGVRHDQHVLVYMGVRKFIIAELSIRKLGSSSVLIILL